MLTANEAKALAIKAQKANCKKLEQMIKEYANLGYKSVTWKEATDGKICDADYPEKIKSLFEPYGYKVFYTFFMAEDCYDFTIKW